MKTLLVFILDFCIGLAGVGPLLKAGLALEAVILLLCAAAFTGMVFLWNR